MTDVFVGRQAELNRLNALLDEARAGNGQVCFVVGEPGSGKTALVLHLIEEALVADPDLLVAMGSGNAQTGISDPYLLFRETLAMLTGESATNKLTERVVAESDGHLTAMVSHTMQILIEVAPDLVGLFMPGAKIVGTVGKVVAKQVGWMDELQNLTQRRPAPALEQSRIFEQFTRFIASLSESHPLILFLDDLQWADDASLGLLFHLARRLESSRVLIIGCYRPSELALGRNGERHLLAGIVNELRRYYGEIMVNLDETLEEEGRRFIDDLIDTEPNQLGPTFRDALYHYTEGHPLFAVELLRQLQEQGDLTRNEIGEWIEGPQLDWDELPARVEGVIQQRLGRLAPNLHEDLVVASIEGDEFTAEVLALVRGEKMRQLLRRLDNELSERHRLVHPQGLYRVGAQRLALFRFRHNLFQEYLYSHLDEIERAYLHEDVGNALETLYGDHAQEVALQLARHFEIAEVAEKAIAYLELAAERARALYAPREAASHLTRALDLAEQSGISTPPRHYSLRGWAYETMGDFEAARDDYTSALDIARQQGDRYAEWRALVDLGELWASRDYEHTGQYYQEALEIARASKDDEALANCLNRIANWRLNTGHPAETLRYHREALAIFEAAGNRSAVAETLDLLGMASLFAGDLVQGLRYYRQALEVFGELDQQDGVANVLASMMMTGTHYLSETMVVAQLDPTQCAHDGERALQMARDMGWRSAEAFAASGLGFSWGAQGQYGKGLRYAQEGLETAEAVEHQQWATASHCALGAIYRDILALSEAREHLEQGLEMARELGSLFWKMTATGFLASTYTKLHETDRAQSLLEGTLNPNVPIHAMGQELVWCSRVELALARGDPEGALERVDRMLAATPNVSSERVVPRLARLRGEALSALGHTDQARSVLQTGLRAATAQGAQPSVWRLHQDLGDLWMLLGEPDKAKEELDAARAVVQRLAATIPDAALRRQFVLRALRMQ